MYNEKYEVKRQRKRENHRVDLILIESHGDWSFESYLAPEWKSFLGDLWSFASDSVAAFLAFRW